MKESTRINWIDISKGITIILVVLGHVLRDGVLQKIIYSFHVSAFFFISGMLSEFTEAGKRIKKDFKNIMLPYYTWGIISILVYFVLGNFAAGKFGMNVDTSLIVNVKNLLYGTAKGGRLQFNTPLWFLPCLFITKVMYYWISNIVRENHRTIKILCSSCIVAILGFIYSGISSWYLPLSFQIATKMLPLFVIGNISKKMLIGMQKKHIDKIKLSASCVIILIITLVIGYICPKINYSGDTFPNAVALYTGGYLGSIGICLLSIIIDKCNWLEYIGKNTLHILVMHKFPVLLFQTVGPLKELLKDTDSVKSCVAAIFVTIVSVVLSLFAERIIRAILKRVKKYLETVI